MKKQSVKLTIVVLTTGIIIASCTPFISREDESMQTLGTKVTHLTKMIEAAVRYDGATLSEGEERLIEVATSHQPGFLRYFDEYVVKVDIIADHAIVLVCTKDGKRGLYEDTACEAGPDISLWKSRRECEFTLSSPRVIEMCEE